MKENSFDLEKFGFSLVDSPHRYECEMMDGIKVIVKVYADVFTIYTQKANGDPDLKIANRYKVETQEQLDFLICNGRIGWWFKRTAAHC